MSRILTGIQSSGKIHLGNILGGIGPALELGANQAEASYFFIADFHALTTFKDAQSLKEQILHTAAAWLACGLDTEKDVFYRQSQVPEVTELAWILNCFAPYPMLANAHSFKDKSANLSNVNAGLFTYPVLMAADILLYDAEQVPVGKDQKQHIEITRDLAGTFNRAVGQELLIQPEAMIREEVMTVPGTDGRKMSKSYNNTICLFDDDKTLKKAVMSIVTDSTPVEAPKDPDTCNVFAIYKLVASETQVEDLRQQYLAGGMGYGKAKQALLDCLMEKYHDIRVRYNQLMANPLDIEAALETGEAKARIKAREVLDRVRSALGFQQRYIA